MFSKEKIILTASALGMVVALAACSPSPKGSGAGDTADRDSDSNVIAFEWNADSDCAVCHDEAISFEETSCLASLHVELKDSCASCHDDEAGLAEVHEGVMVDDRNVGDRLKKTDVGEEVCASCHVKAELAQATASSTVLTDREGTVVNPHDIPSNEDHGNAGIICSDCHKFHQEDSPIAESAQEVCSGCHHDGVYECGTCHD